MLKMTAHLQNSCQSQIQGVEGEEQDGVLQLYVKSIQPSVVTSEILDYTCTNIVTSTKIITGTQRSKQSACTWWCQEGEASSSRVR